MRKPTGSCNRMQTQAQAQALCAGTPAHAGTCVPHSTTMTAPGRLARDLNDHYGIKK